MSLSTLNMTQQEWLEDRRKGIGGSDVATILGLNKYKSAYQLWLEKTGQIELEQTESEPAYWGTALEPLAAKRFSDITGKKVRRRNQIFEHSHYPFLRANIDRDVIGENAILECKTASVYLSDEWTGEEVPAAYLCQIQHYMNVLDADYCYMAVLIGGQKFIWKKIERDADLINLIEKQLIYFWETNVIGMVEPPIDGSDATSDFLKERYKDINENETQLPKRFDDLIHSRIDLKRSEKEIKKEIKRVENELVQELGKRDASIGITPSFIVSWKLQERRSIDKNALVEKYPDVAKDESIYKTSSFRTLKEKEIK